MIWEYLSFFLYFKSGKHGIYNEKPGTDRDKNDAG